MKPLSLKPTLSAASAIGCAITVFSALPSSYPEKLRGYRSSDFEIRSDSIVDFSAVAKYGKQCEWGYLRLESGELIENRETETGI